MGSVKRYGMGDLRVRRLDSGGPELTPEGYLRCDATIGKAGLVLLYINPADGKLRRELRTPDAVFDPDAMASFRMLPVTDGHPPQGLVTAEDIKALQCGSVGDSITRDGNLLRAPLMITDKALVAKVLLAEQRGVPMQISPAYQSGRGPPGVFEGQAYDSEQTEIRGNAIAIVPRGRQGPDVRVHLDALDAVETLDDLPAFSPPPGPGVETMFKITLISADGTKFVFEGDPASVQAQVQAFIASQQEASDARTDVANQKAAAAATALQTQAAQTQEATTGLKTAQAGMEQEKARADAAEKQLKVAEKARLDAADPVRIRELISGRVSLEGRAVKVLGAEAKLDAMDDAAVKLAVLAKLEPEEKFDGKTPEYVDAYFASAMKRFEAAGTWSRERLDAAPKASLDAPGNAAEVSAVDAAARREQRTKDAWKAKAEK